MKRIAILSALALLTACAPEMTLQEYTPVVDKSKVNSAKFNRDLTACRAVAVDAQAKYQAGAQAQAQNQAIAGLFVGALLGAAIGGDSSYAAEGALYGAAAGATDASVENADLVKYGPRRIVDRCMDDRGYRILSDIGKG